TRAISNRKTLPTSPRSRKSSKPAWLTTSRRRLTPTRRRLPAAADRGAVVGAAGAEAAPAKINLTLRVLGRRPDGYHEIESLVAAITLYDELTFGQRTAPGFELRCEHPAVPRDGTNLIARAADRLASRAGVSVRLTCELVK